MAIEWIILFKIAFIFMSTELKQTYKKSKNKT